MPVLSIGGLVVRIAVSLMLLLALAWAAAAVWIDGPASSVLAGTLASTIGLASVLATVLVRPFWRAVSVIIVPFALVLSWWLTLEPSNDRERQPVVSRLLSATTDGSQLTNRNVRGFEYRDERDVIALRTNQGRSYDLCLFRRSRKRHPINGLRGRTDSVQNLGCPLRC